MEWDPCLSPTSLRPHFLVLLCACMSAAAAASAPHAHTPTHARRHISGLPQQQESIHQRLKTPTDARHYAKLSGPHVTSDLANCTAAPFKPLRRVVSMLSDQTHTRACKHTCSLSIFGLLDYLALLPLTALTALTICCQRRKITPERLGENNEL